MNKCLLLFVLCIITSVALHAQNVNDLLFHRSVSAQDVDYINELAVFDPKIEFKDFKVPVYKGPKAKLDIHSNPTARRFRTVLSEGYKKTGVNFGGHYVLIFWGCGSPCQMGAIVDAKNGKVYDIPGAGSEYDNKADSRMLIVNPPAQNPPDPKWYYHKNTFSEIPYIFVFNEKTKKFKEHPYKHN